MRTVFLLLLLAASSSAQTWRFAVSGDSRNCGDVVMPAIAAGVKADHAVFYWHLGDFRRLSKIDDDMLRASKNRLTMSAYESAAWPDFIQRQLQPFAPIPVYLGIGNHELYGRSRSDYLAQFGGRLPAARTYYDWIQDGIDFVTLDNASKDMFDADQMNWFDHVLAKDAADSNVKTVVVGMHEALPHSLTCDHSMNESDQGEASGSRVYQRLLQFREKTHKNVYVIASHAHFWMREPYDSAYWRAHGGVLPGLVIGAAGATRYRLPDTAQSFSSDRAKTDVYGYALATVQPDGTITFQFREISRASIPADVLARYGADGVDWCFAQNRDPKPRISAPCAAADSPPGPAPRRQSSN